MDSRMTCDIPHQRRHVLRLEIGAQVAGLLGPGHDPHKMLERDYALTLHTALAGQGVHAGTLTIGGLIERGDIHHVMTSQHDAADMIAGTLAPDDLAWTLYAERDKPEAVFNALT
jgi:hypothetical protein